MRSDAGASPGLPRCAGCARSEEAGMEWDDAFPFLLLALVAAAVFAAKMRGQIRDLRLQYAGLTQRFSMLDERVVRLAEQLAAFREGQPPLADLAPSAPVSPPASEAVPAEAAEEPLPAPVTVPPPPDLMPLPVAAAGHWEQVLVENWMVWLGGAALALGGAFLVKLSIDYGLLTPAVRVTCGVLLGIALSVGAEWVRRREMPLDSGDAGPSYVPQ